MARDEQRQQLVRDRAAVDLLAAVAQRAEHQREDVDALGEPRVGEVHLDQALHERSKRPRIVLKRPPGLQGPRSRRRNFAVTSRWPTAVSGGSSSSSSASSAPSAPKTARRITRV